MALSRQVYNLLFRRTSTFALTIMVGAVLFERIFDQGGDALFEQLNRGVSRPGTCGVGLTSARTELR
nr:PREDICTED: cytochrome b-c1 complex subunit 9 isoform X1 [Latimeria chalumnae]|eukprot:XP_014354560.1 PREDICTED: cytochrome b-c1 complex subunit 9 isoform X1 [Latimeria chalumnae]